MKHIILNSTAILLTVFSFFVNDVNAQDKRERKIFEKGTIVCSLTGRNYDDNHRASKEAYDPNIIGVATGDDNRLHVYELVQTDGVAVVKYSGENGNIKKGDLIAASSKEGIAMKATAPGVVLGMALEDGENTSGLIKVRILIQYYNGK